jgi:hypothetical protein
MGIERHRPRGQIKSAEDEQLRQCLGLLSPCFVFFPIDTQKDRRDPGAGVGIWYLFGLDG